MVLSTAHEGYSGKSKFLEHGGISQLDIARLYIAEVSGFLETQP